MIFGCPVIYLGMFLRKKKNKSGSTSVQIISKRKGSYKVVKTIGCAQREDEILRLYYVGKREMMNLQKKRPLFIDQEDELIRSFLYQIENSQVKTVGPELIFGKIYDAIGYNQIKENLFRHLVIARLAFPLSKLKTIDYLYRFSGIKLSIDKVYRFLDKLSNQLKQQVEDITFKHISKLLNHKFRIVFYDMTTLHFEASDEDDFRKMGFSKEGKHKNPQIFLGLLVSPEGYAIGYDIFEGNICEGHTLIPFLERISEKFGLSKPIVVADAGLLSKKNINTLIEKQYEYIIGARIKTETNKLKNKILSRKLNDGEAFSINRTGNKKLVISFSEKRRKKDQNNRKRGLQSLEKKIKKNNLTKAHLNNRGYNKYLKMSGNLSIQIDYEKFNDDAKWDGLKGYETNTKLSLKEIIRSYSNLWRIEKAFRISKTDLRIRPIYHRLKNRIEAHICISFTAYTIYKELERILQKEGAKFSLKQAAELTQNMYKISFFLPNSKEPIEVLLKMDEKQAKLKRFIDSYFRVSQC